LDPQSDLPTFRSSCSISPSLAVRIPAHFSKADCARWVTGTLAARPHWTADFGTDQFSLGRAFYTHLEQGKSNTYFADASASDARVEAHAHGLQSAMRALAASLVSGVVRQRIGWCGPGIHIFPAHGHVAKHGGTIHFDTEGLTQHHIERRAPAITVVAMLQPPARGGGLRTWDLLYDGRDGVEDDELRAHAATTRYEICDVVVIDSYRLHQIRPFRGEVDRISATIHLAEVDGGHWESWF
jgi:hypothetical protein